MPAVHGHAHEVHQEHADELQFSVEGMTCAGCAATIQRSLELLDGVDSASVSVLNGRATITGRRLDPDVVVRAIRSSGFAAQPLNDRPAPAELRSEIEH